MKFHPFWIPCLILLITVSCINYEQVTVIKKDGSGEMYIHYWMKWNSSEDSTVICSAEIFQPDSINTEFNKSFININSVEVYKQKFDSTIHAKIEVEYVHIDSLNNTDIFYLSRFKMVDGPNETKIFSQFVPPIVQGFGSDKSPQNFQYTYYLPGKILSHNADEIDRNKLIWNIKSDQIGTGKFLSATFTPFRLKETPDWVYYCALGVFLIVIIFLFSRNK